MGNPNPGVELNGSSCANCSCILNGDINRSKIYNLNVLICMPKESADLMSCERVSVISALRDLYSDSFELYGRQQRQTGSSKDPNNENIDDIPLCVPCSLILQDLYRSYRLFKSVRKESSYISHITHSGQSDNNILRNSSPQNVISTDQHSNSGNCTNSGGNQTDSPRRRPRPRDGWRFEPIPNQTLSVEPVQIKFELHDDDIMMDDLAAPEMYSYPPPTEAKRLRQLEQSIENSILGIAAEEINSECGVSSETNQSTGAATDHAPVIASTNFNVGSANCPPARLAEVSWVVQKNCGEEEYMKNCSTSQREGKVLWHEGYPFTIQKRLPNGNLRYICRRRRGLKCSGALMLYTTGIQALTVKHDPPHEAILVEKDIDLYRQLLKERSLSHPSDSPKDVVAHVLSQFPPNVAQELSQNKVPTGYYVRQIRQKKSIQLGHSVGLIPIPTPSSFLSHQNQLLLSPSSGNDEMSKSMNTETNSTTSGA